MSHKYFQNESCKFFPCKPGEPNCLLCYCPLYLLDNCGGDWQIFNDMKDCSGCHMTDGESGWLYVVECLREELNKQKFDGVWKKLP